MKIKPFYASSLPGLFGAAAITLYPFVFIAASKDDPWAFRLVRHEVIHVRQVRALGWFYFYATYVWEWIKNIAAGKTRDDAYRSISYEADAYAQERNSVLTDSECVEFGFKVKA